ncbi:hypothetical protein D3C87_162750 [compost metagenome]
MKKKLLLGASLLLTTFTMTACLSDPNPGTKALDKVKRDNEQRQQELNKELETLLNNPLLLSGGQPGKISVSGIVVKQEGEKTLLDERITVTQVPGKSGHSSLTTNIKPANKAALTPELDAKELGNISEGKTFINVNCNQLDPSLVEGLTEANPDHVTKDFLVIAANTVVLCKDVSFTTAMTTISADHLVLIDVDSTLDGRSLGFLKFKANKLTLIGKNKITTKGKDSTSPFIDGESASLSLDVAKEIQGEGTLELTTLGGNYISSPAKK